MLPSPLIVKFPPVNTQIASYPSADIIISWPFKSKTTVFLICTGALNVIFEVNLTFPPYCISFMNCYSLERTTLIVHLPTNFPEVTVIIAVPSPIKVTLPS